MQAPVAAWKLALKHLSPGVWVVLTLLLISVALIALSDNPSRRDASVEMWVFSPEHELMYDQVLTRTNEDDVRVSIMSIDAIKSRMLSGFFAQLPTADLIELERGASGAAFNAPEGAVGFTDLTPLLERDGLEDAFNPPSLSPWTAHGRIYGLPHDVHPVMLAYRADITEAAGIDLSSVETWDEYFEALRPLAQDSDNDGHIDHHPLSFWYTQPDNIELLLLQGGGALFDESGRPTLDSEINARILARIVSWCVGPEKLAVEIEEFSAAGHKDRIDGRAIGHLCPDWMVSIWRLHAPELGGKLKLMPLPAFEPGGTRTSIRGGTMIGIPKSSEHPKRAWDLAIELYTSPHIARELYTTLDIITPVRSLWDDPVYDEPDPFFMGQPKGRLFIEMAPHIPVRSSSPFNFPATLEFRDAAVRLARSARSDNPRSLEERAAAYLKEAQASLEHRMNRFVYAPVPDDDQGGGS